MTEDNELIGNVYGKVSCTFAEMTEAAQEQMALERVGTVPDQHDETQAGYIVWHSSEEDGGPDVGISLGLGDGKLMWIGERSRAAGGGYGMMIYADDRLIVNASLSDCDEMIALAEHHLAPILTAYRNHQVEL